MPDARTNQNGLDVAVPFANAIADPAIPAEARRIRNKRTLSIHCAQRHAAFSFSRESFASVSCLRGAGCAAMLSESRDENIQIFEYGVLPAGGFEVSFQDFCAPRGFRVVVFFSHFFQTRLR